MKKQNYKDHYDEHMGMMKKGAEVEKAPRYKAHEMKSDFPDIAYGQSGKEGYKSDMEKIKRQKAHCYGRDV